MASPNRLLRNTSYDARQILSWIDEALLVTTLPRNWQKLEDNGITGAIDLVWYHVNPAPAAPADPAPIVVPPAPPHVPAAPAPGRPSLQTLATQTGIDVGILRDVVDRLFEDAQVQLVWVLYQKDSHEVN